MGEVLNGDINKYSIEMNKSHIFRSIDIKNKIKLLRLKNDTTLKELSKKVNISEYTLRLLEEGNIKRPYPYYKKICDFFQEDYFTYFNIHYIKEETPQEKLEKIKAYLAIGSWKELSKYIGHDGGWVKRVIDSSTVPEYKIKEIDYWLKKVKEL